MRGVWSVYATHFPSGDKLIGTYTGNERIARASVTASGAIGACADADIVRRTHSARSTALHRTIVIGAITLLTPRT